MDQLEVKLKLIVINSHAFSRAHRRPHAFASSSDWLIGLSVFVVIGQSDFFGFCRTTLN